MGFSGTMTFAETPLHFGVVLLLVFIFLLFVLFSIISVMRSEYPSASDFSGYKAVITGFFAWQV